MQQTNNAQHLSLSNEWLTPPSIIDLVHDVIPQIDLDPASCAESNEYIKASHYFTEGALEKPWTTPKVPITVFLNPPGGKVNNKSQSTLFWNKLMELRSQQLLEEAIFLGFSLEQLATTQSCEFGIADFPVCIPRRRIKFISRSTGLPMSSPTHNNLICYVPGRSKNIKKFIKAFDGLGTCMQPFHFKHF